MCILLFFKIVLRLVQEGRQHPTDSDRERCCTGPDNRFRHKDGPPEYQPPNRRSGLIPWRASHEYAQNAHHSSHYF